VTDDLVYRLRTIDVHTRLTRFTQTV